MKSQMIKVYLDNIGIRQINPNVSQMKRRNIVAHLLHMCFYFGNRKVNWCVYNTVFYWWIWNFVVHFLLLLRETQKHISCWICLIHSHVLVSYPSIFLATMFIFNIHLSQCLVCDPSKFQHCTTFGCSPFFIGYTLV